MIESVPRPVSVLLAFLFVGSAVAVPTRDAAHFSAVPEFAQGADKVNWEALPRLVVERVRVFSAQENVAGYNMHPAITYFDGRWWAMWSSGAWGEDMPGQKVRAANSVDGIKWENFQVIAEPDDPALYMLTPTGYWVRDGELLGMVIHRRGKPVVNGKRQKVEGPLDFTVRFYRRLPNGRWELAAKLPDTFNDKPIERLSTGEYTMVRSTSDGKRFFGVAGSKAIDDWTFFPIPAAADKHKMSEAHLYELADGGLTMLFRDNSKSLRIYRSFSEDRGHTWSPPVGTDFPDSAAKFSVLRLSTGRYIMVSNPRPHPHRFPLCVSLSNDGVVFDRTYVIVDAQPGPRLENFTKHPGAQYPQAIEHDGNVMIAYSLHQEDIEVVKIPVAEFSKR